MKLFISGGHLIDPTEGQNSGKNLLIEDGKIVAWLGQNESAPEDAEVFDATGLIVAPGFIDLHVHLREPGQEHKETIASGCTAAVPASRFRRQPPSSMGHAIIVMGVIRRAVSGCVAVPLAPLVPSSPVLLVVARPLAHDLPGPCGQPACRNWLEAGWMTMATRGRAVFVLFG